MKYLNIALFLGVVIFSSPLSGQAELIITQAEFEPDVIDNGDGVTVRTTVKNIGNVTAGENYLYIYFSKDLEIEYSEIASRVSIQALGPGEEQEVIFFYPISTELTAGNYYVALEIDPSNVVPETDDSNLYCVSNEQGCSTFNVTGYWVPAQRYNYPILFVHGLNGNSKTWDEFTQNARRHFGWRNGGGLDYCLNPDDDNSTSDGYVLSFVDQNNLRAGDYYTVNFDVNSLGELFVSEDYMLFNNFQSNQSAIFKQGLALRDAVQKVLAFSGADKVILVGHSMGGLASRQYLQNTENWQPDGEHHVVKLLTIGTPHGGSNLTGSVLSQVIGIDESAEATRDLRYPSLLYGGQFLAGGVESPSSIYYNNDINCNGQVGDLITGLNEKNAPALVDYSCIVGIGNNLPSLSGDGVVAASRADLNNYLSAPPPFANQHADRYLVTTNHRDIHKENESVLIRALDEPDFHDLAYPLPLEKFTLSHTSEQAVNHPIPPPGEHIDWDDFVVEVPVGGEIRVRVWNIPVHAFGAFIYDQWGNLLAQGDSEGKSQLTISTEVPAGTYYVEYGSVPTDESWRFPYAHYVDVEPVQPVVASFSTNIAEGCAPIQVIYTSESSGNPDTYAWSFPGGTPSSSNLPQQTVTYATPGNYSARLVVSNEISSDNLVRTNLVAASSLVNPSFTYAVQNNLNVAFTDESEIVGEVPTYLWDFGDGQTGFQASPNHTYAAVGTYNVVLTTTNSCGSTTTAQVIDLSTTASSNLSDELSVTISPNPGSDDLKLELSGNFTGRFVAAIYSSNGQIITTKELHKGSQVSNFSFDVSTYPSGPYQIRLTARDFSRTIQFIKI